MRAIQVNEFGGPEVMNLSELPDPEPADGMVIVDVARCGINFADTHATRDDYLAKQSLPMVPGGEISGRTPDGRRVAAILGGGGYAEKVAVPEGWLVPLSDAISDDVAAGMLLQGLTAHALVHRCARLEPGETIVVEAAGGGTGTLAVQLAKRAAGRVIALASSESKRELATRLGADAAIDSRSEDLGDAIIEANGGEPVDAVLEMSGGETFETCLRALAPFGRLVAFGNASRQPNQIDTGHLMRHSRAVIGFWLMHLVGRRELVASMVADLMQAIEAGELEVVIGGVYPMSEVRQAHSDLAARRTHGKLLLDPAG
ncbi:MAG: zinc-binding dehydrogenase [bacterium]